MTQLDLAGTRSRYGRTASPTAPEALAAVVEQLVAAGVPYPGDLTDPGEPLEGARSTSLLLTMRDGVRVALDVHVPPLAPGQQVPTCLRSTRYWRGTAGSPLKEHLEVLEVQRWLRAGFALVLVDARGTGASFGTWSRAWDDDQRDDLVEVVDWVVTQGWSDGTVGGYGTSYDGTTAHLLAATGHPAVRAVVPRFALYDSYADISAPGGVPLDHFLEHWSAINWALDGHAHRGTVPLPLALAGDVRRVDEDPDGSLLAAARSEHVDNWDLWSDAATMTAREDLGPVDLGNGTPHARRQELVAAAVPQWLWSGWYDGAYAAAQLRQLADPDLDVRVTIGPFSHGASLTTLGDPLRPEARNVPVSQQVSAIAAFLRHRLTGEGEDPSPPALRYYRLGDGWHESAQWPPADVVRVRHALEPRRWRVDPAASTGRSGTRWHCLIGGGAVVYPDRREQDQHLLVWELPCAHRAVTGTPLVHLDVTSSVPDLALHVYLEAVLPDERVLYLTEGVLSASHRHLASATTSTTTGTPDRPADPVQPGVPAAWEWELLPISVLLPAGSRLRVSLAGADVPLFRRIPATGDVDLDVAGWLELPHQP